MKEILIGMIVILSLVLVGCPGTSGGGGGTDLLNLTGNITITPSSDVEMGDTLTAVYTGTEEVNYQWKRGSTNVGTNSDTYSPEGVGNHTVTVSLSGYKSKTSSVVYVGDVESIKFTLEHEIDGLTITSIYIMTSSDEDVDQFLVLNLTNGTSTNYKFKIPAVPSERYVIYVYYNSGGPTSRVTGGLQIWTDPYGPHTTNFLVRFYKDVSTIKLNVTQL